MAISADVLASALQDLAPGYSETFMKWHPVFEKIVARGGVQTKDLQGPYKQFTVVTQGPGSTTEVVYGSELVKGGRKQVASSGTSYAPRLIHAFDVPRKELDEANGAQDLAKILEKYPELAMGEFHEQIASQLATGAGANNLGGFLTLNGGIGNTGAGNTYNPGGIGARQGVRHWLGKPVRRLGGFRNGRSSQDARSVLLLLASGQDSRQGGYHPRR